MQDRVCVCGGARRQIRACDRSSSLEEVCPHQCQKDTNWEQLLASPAKAACVRAAELTFGSSPQTTSWHITRPSAYTSEEGDN